MAATMPAEEATVITRTSRWATWESSCASTPSSSSPVRRLRMPVVTTTAEWPGERPVANAFGNSVSAIPTRGLGMSASTHSRSIIACSSGASSGVTSRARIAFIATESELYHWNHTTPRPMSAMKNAYCGRIAMSTAMTPTKIAPSRKITVVIRAVSPASPTNRVRAMSPFSGVGQASGGAALARFLLGLLGLAGLDRLRRAARLEGGQLGLDVGLRAQGVELAGDVVATADRAHVVDRPGAGLHLGGLVLGPLDRGADVAELVTDARHRLVDLGLRLGRRVGGLDRLLAGAELLDLRLEPLLGEGELLLLGLELGELHLEVVDLARQPGLAGERLPGEVLAVGGDRLLRLVLELGRLLLELGDLELDPLAAGGDVDHASAYLAEQLDLALVAVVERLARVLGAVQHLVGLGLEDQGEALPHAHQGLSLSEPSAGASTLGAKSSHGYGAGTLTAPFRPLTEGLRVVPSQQVRARTRAHPREGGRQGASHPDPQGGRGGRQGAGQDPADPQGARRGPARRRDVEQVDPAGDARRRRALLPRPRQGA